MMKPIPMQQGFAMFSRKNINKHHAFRNYKFPIRIQYIPYRGVIFQGPKKSLNLVWSVSVRLIPLNITKASLSSKQGNLIFVPSRKVCNLHKQIEYYIPYLFPGCWVHFDKIKISRGAFR